MSLSHTGLRKAINCPSFRVCDQWSSHLVFPALALLTTFSLLHLPTFPLYQILSQTFRYVAVYSVFKNVPPFAPVLLQGPRSLSVPLHREVSLRSCHLRLLSLVVCRQHLPLTKNTLVIKLTSEFYIAKANRDFSFLTFLNILAAVGTVLSSFSLKDCDLGIRDNIPTLLAFPPIFQPSPL